MRRRWLYVPAILSALLVVAYGVAVSVARPAPSYSYFLGGRSGVQVIAHRGGGGLRPENTLAAFSHAGEIGVDVFEMDVQLTADGAIVCIHDATVDRTTDGRGRVDSLTLHEVQKLDAGYRWSPDGGHSYPFRGTGVRVPALEDVFARFPQMHMILEMKRTGAGLARPLCDLVRRSGMAQRTLVASFDHDAMAAFRDACPEVATSLTAREARWFHALYRAKLAPAYSPSAPALLMPYRLRDEVIATREFIEAVQRRNLKVHVWTVNRPERMQDLIGIGVDGIMTDHPDRLLALVGRLAEPPRASGR